MHSKGHSCLQPVTASQQTAGLTFYLSWFDDCHSFPLTLLLALQMIQGLLECRRQIIVLLAQSALQLGQLPKRRLIEKSLPWLLVVRPLFLLHKVSLFSSLSNWWGRDNIHSGSLVWLQEQIDVNVHSGSLVWLQEKIDVNIRANYFVQLLECLLVFQVLHITIFDWNVDSTNSISYSNLV